MKTKLVEDTNQAGQLPKLQVTTLLCGSVNFIMWDDGGMTNMDEVCKKGRGPRGLLPNPMHRIGCQNVRKMYSIGKMARRGGN